MRGSAGPAEHVALPHTVWSPGTLPRLLPAGGGAAPASLAGHLARYGLPPAGRDPRHRESLIAEVERAGLTGRGGAGYPTARKLAAVAAGHVPVVVANGTEGEPASAKDKALMARSPQLVLDGAVLAAEMVGARETVIVVHAAVRRVIDQAVAERARARFDRVRIKVRTAANQFVAGEASAVVHWVERGVPTPTASPPRVSETGLHGSPTLVQNVETLAHLALIARYGAAWFRSVGTPTEPGSMLVTVLGAVRNPPSSRSRSALPSPARSTWLAARRRRSRHSCSAGTSATGCPQPRPPAGRFHRQGSRTSVPGPGPA